MTASNADILAQHFMSPAVGHSGALYVHSGTDFPPVARKITLCAQVSSFNADPQPCSLQAKVKQPRCGFTGIFEVDQSAHAPALGAGYGKGSLTALRQTLQRLGWIEGSNLQIHIRFGAVNSEIRRHVAELAALAPDVIFANSTTAAGLLVQATRTIPIVFVNVADPVGAGIVDSLSRPGGNAGASRSHKYRRDRPVWRNPGGGAVARRGGEPSQRA
jgi:hypothetical protein